MHCPAHVGEIIEGITKEEVELWQIDITSGVSISQIARKYNRAYSVIKKRLREEPTYRRLTLEERDNIKKLFKEGKRYRPRISVANCDSKMIDKFQGLLPWFTRGISHRHVEKWLPLHTLKLQNKAIVRLVCVYLTPYMCCKKEEMEIMIRSMDNNMDTSIVSELSRVKKAKNNRVIIR